MDAHYWWTVGYAAFLLTAVEVLVKMSRGVRVHGAGRDAAEAPSSRPGKGLGLPWPRSDICAFYAGLGLVLAVLSGFISVASVVRQPTLPGGMLQGMVVVVAAVEGIRCRRVQRALRPEQFR